MSAPKYPPKRGLRFVQSRIVTSVDVAAALSATTTLPVKLADGPLGAKALELCAPGGLAADSANYWVITLVDTTTSTTLATWSTQTGHEGALTANLQPATMASPAVGNEGDQLAIVCTKHGSAANLPAQTRFVVHTDESC